MHPGIINNCKKYDLMRATITFDRNEQQDTYNRHFGVKNRRSFYVEKLIFWCTTNRTLAPVGVRFVVHPPLVARH